MAGCPMPGLTMQTHCSPDFPFKVNAISLHAASSLQCPHQLTLGPQLSRMKKADNGLKQIFVLWQANCQCGNGAHDLISPVLQHNNKLIQITKISLATFKWYNHQKNRYFFKVGENYQIINRKVCQRSDSSMKKTFTGLWSHSFPSHSLTTVKRKRMKDINLC